MDYSDQVPQQRAGFPRAPDGRGGPYYDRSRTITDEEMNDISQQNPSGSRTGTGQGMDGTEVLDVMHEVGGYGSQFSLVVLQQPQTGGVSGLSTQTLGRLPIVPAPILQLITKRNNKLMDIDLPFLFCSCSLVKEADEFSFIEEIKIVPPIIPPAPVSRARKNKGPPPPPPMQENIPFVSPILGKSVATFQRMTDSNGTPAIIFIFDDLSVREAGNYRLRFRLAEARPGSVELASGLSNPFKVLPIADYPGLPSAEIVTPLTRRLHSQSIPIYLPPLAIPRRYMPSIAPDVAPQMMAMLPFPGESAETP